MQSIRLAEVLAPAAVSAKTACCLLPLALVSLLRAARLRLDHRKLQFPLQPVDAVEQDAQSLADGVGLARTLADDLARVLAVGVAVVGERGERHQALDEQVFEFDEEAELGHADDERRELVADAVA